MREQGGRVGRIGLVEGFFCETLQFFCVVSCLMRAPGAEQIFGQRNTQSYGEVVVVVFVCEIDRAPE